MRIQHNIAALNTAIKLKNQQNINSKHLERLSSGFKINRAGDDVAGLTISEKMRGQIRGLNMAGKNIQDGISLIQTAEGAMNEIHSLLQRGRELSVQAANDTNTKEDRGSLQMEVNQILDEINGISDRTEFNGMKLLRGGGTITPPSGGAGSTVSDATLASKQELATELARYMLEASEDAVATAFGIGPSPTRDMTISFVNQSPGGAVAWVSSGGFVGDPSSYSFKLVIDEADFLTDSPLWISKDRIIAHEMVHAMMSASGMKWLDDSIPTWFKEGSAEYLAGANERLKGSLSILGSAQNVVNAIDSSESSSHFYSAGYAATRFLDKVLHDNGSDIKALMQELAPTSYADPSTAKTFDQALKSIFGSSFGELEFIAKFKNEGAAYINSLDLSGTGSILGDLLDDANVIDDSDMPVDEGDYFNYIWDNSTGYTEGSPYISYSSPTINLNGDLKFHIGANSGQAITINLATITSDSLNLSTADVKLFADHTITIFDSAIEVVSTERSKLGAVQNRLEHAYNSTVNTSENLTAAESRIRDTDMAKEMMNFTKSNILMQAAQTMLSQANQQPQGVSQLLA